MGDVKAIVDQQGALSEGRASVRAQFQVPEAFPDPVIAAARLAAARSPIGHTDLLGRPFVTLDPETSTDLDQAFAIEQSGNDLLLHYAIADVSYFVDPGDAVDVEAWKRGTTIYLPDGKASLYPQLLSEGAASLLPNVERPAAVSTVRVAPDGSVKLDGVERAMIRSQAKLAYETVKLEDFPLITEVASRIRQAELRRGAEPVDTAEQLLVPGDKGQPKLVFRPQLESEVQNAALSLAANLATADMLYAHKTGLFRVMAEPGQFAIDRLRHTAKALKLKWPGNVSLIEFERTLLRGNPQHEAFKLAVRRASPGAGYSPYQDGVRPWHSAMAATYAHGTAPLRRLADRYVIEAALAVAAGSQPDEATVKAFAELPAVMAKADAKASQVERAVLDLAEAVLLQGREGERFHAVVTDIDERGARIQICDPAVVARVDAKGLAPGDELDVELVSTDVVQRRVVFRGLS
jgi:VacB/RNase II family 3'-5' exoribonuclease